MELTGIDNPLFVLCALAMAAGVLGVVVPVLPGLILCWASVLVWAIFGDAGQGRWLVLGAATVIALVGSVVKYAWPGRRLKESGVPRRAIILGGLLGLIGFFVVPIVGLPLGFVLGIFVAERLRLGRSGPAWASTKHAVKAVGLAQLVELAAALGIAGVWAAGLAWA